MKFEFLPTGETCVGYWWGGFKKGEIASDPIRQYDSAKYGDGYTLCQRCTNFKASHGLMEVGREVPLFLCPGTYVLTTPDGQKMLVYEKDSFFKNFRVISTEFVNKSLELVPNEGDAVVSGPH